MKAIVCSDMNWGIGFEGNLLVKIPQDMKRFKKLTTGNIVVMGSETFMSLPGKKPLKDRTNIVLSRNKKFIGDGLIVYRSIDELLLNIKKYPSDSIFVIGGESVYKQLLSYCTMAYVTRVDSIFEADRHFVNLDNHKSWNLTFEGKQQNHDNISYKYLIYENTMISLP